MWKTAFKKFEDMVCLSKPYSFKLFKGCLLQKLLNPILSTLSQILKITRTIASLVRSISEIIPSVIMSNTKYLKKDYKHDQFYQSSIFCCKVFLRWRKKIKSCCGWKSGNFVGNGQIVFSLKVFDFVSLWFQDTETTQLICNSNQLVFIFSSQSDFKKQLF